MNFTNTEKVLNEFARFFIERYRGELDNGKINASYKLSDTLQYIIDINGMSIDVVVMLQDYYKYIESGRRAGAKMPPISAIEEWIKVKPVLPYPMSNGKLPTTRQLAYLIARSISRNGIPPKPIFQMSIEEATDAFYERIEKAVREDLETDIQDFIISTFRKLQR